MQPPRWCDAWRRAEGHVEALGVDGRLLQLQLYDLTHGIDQLATLLELDYRTEGDERFSLDVLSHLPAGDILDPVSVATAIGFSAGNLDQHLNCRGYRVVSQSAQMTTSQAGRLLEHFGSLQEVLAASSSALAGVPGVDRPGASHPGRLARCGRRAVGVAAEASRRRAIPSPATPGTRPPRHRATPHRPYRAGAANCTLPALRRTFPQRRKPHAVLRRPVVWPAGRQAPGIDTQGAGPPMAA